MRHLQVLLQGGKAAFVVVPIDLWARVRDAVEEAEDIADPERFDRMDDGARQSHRREREATLCLFFLVMQGIVADSCSDKIKSRRGSTWPHILAATIRHRTS